MSEVKEKLKESLTAILPMMVVVILINYLVLVPNGNSYESDNSLFGPVILSALISCVPLIIGTALFSLGVDKSIAKIGQVVGEKLTKRKSIVALLVVAALMGLLATLAEPDLSVLASRIAPSSGENSLYHWLLIIVAGVGVAIFLVMAILRVVFNKPLKYWLAIGYFLIFALFIFADDTIFATICFDTGGMTTGVVTVPFILAMGMAVAKVMGGNNAEDDSFGYSGLCSLGTVLVITVFFLILQKAGVMENFYTNLNNMFNLANIGTTADEMIEPVSTYSEMWSRYLSNLLGSIKDVAISIAPLIAFFFIFSLFYKPKKKSFISILIGFLYTFIGLVLFFMGAESGFMPVSTAIGKYFGDAANQNQVWVFYVVAFITGFISMLAEPAVRVLANNVSEVSNGVISKKMIFFSLCIAIGLAITLNVIRLRFAIPAIYILFTLFAIAILLSFFTPDIYVGIAIDAAGVSTGTMAGCFFLPMFIGYTATYYAETLDGVTTLSQAFGVVGIMSIFPIISMELIGIISVSKTRLAYKRAFKQVLEADDEQIIHLPSYNMNVKKEKVAE